MDSSRLHVEKLDVLTKEVRRKQDNKQRFGTLEVVEGACVHDFEGPDHAENRNGKLSSVLPDT